MLQTSDPIPEKKLVCIVDDEAAVRVVAEKNLTNHGYVVRAYGSVASFFAEFNEAATSCIITDLQMPEQGGLVLQRRLKAAENIVSLIVLTGYVDVRTAVQIMEDGAFTLLEKPYEASKLIDAVGRAVEATEIARKKRSEIQMIRARFEQLSDDERAVLDLVVEGLPNKAIALKLDLSQRTVDRRRQGILTTMRVESATQLAALIALLDSERKPRLK